MSKVTVKAIIKAKDGMEEKAKQELLTLIKPTLSEEGCINYDLHQSVENKNQFMFYENWKSKEDLDKHLETPHIKAFLAKAEDILAEPVEITLWEMVS